MKFDRRSVWRFAHPDIQVFAFAGFEEQDIVAVVEVGEFVELVKLGFCI